MFIYNTHILQTDRPTDRDRQTNTRHRQDTIKKFFSGGLRPPNYIQTQNNLYDSHDQSYRLFPPGLPKSPATGRQKKFFRVVLENTRNGFWELYTQILGILEKCSEILEELYRKIIKRGRKEGREVETEGFHHERDVARGNRRFSENNPV